MLESRCSETGLLWRYLWRVAWFYWPLAVVAELTNNIVRIMGTQGSPEWKIGTCLIWRVRGIANSTHERDRKSHPERLMVGFSSGPFRWWGGSRLYGMVRREVQLRC